MAELLYTESYIRRAKKFIKRHPNLIEPYRKTLKLLESNPSARMMKFTALDSAARSFIEHRRIQVTSKGTPAPSPAEVSGESAPEPSSETDIDFR